MLLLMYIIGICSRPLMLLCYGREHCWEYVRVVQKKISYVYCCVRHVIRFGTSHQNQGHGLEYM